MEGGKELYVGYHQSKEERAAQQVRLNSRIHQPKQCDQIGRKIAIWAIF